MLNRSSRIKLLCPSFFCSGSWIACRAAIQLYSYTLFPSVAPLFFLFFFSFGLGRGPEFGRGPSSTLFSLFSSLLLYSLLSLFYSCTLLLSLFLSSLLIMGQLYFWVCSLTPQITKTRSSAAALVAAAARSSAAARRLAAAPSCSCCPCFSQGGPLLSLSPCVSQPQPMLQLQPPLRTTETPTISKNSVWMDPSHLLCIRRALAWHMTALPVVWFIYGAGLLLGKTGLSRLQPPCFSCALPSPPTEAKIPDWDVFSMIALIDLTTH
jgi:hypothetical protein